MKKEKLLTTVTCLPKQFEGGVATKGFIFTLFRSSDTHYIYRVDRSAGTHFEVFERKIVPICIDFASRQFSDTEGKEIYPKAEDFGRWAFTYTKEDRAIRKFEDLTNEKES